MSENTSEPPGDSNDADDVDASDSRDIEAMPDADSGETDHEHPTASRLDVDSALTVDGLFELLSDPGNRYVVEYLDHVDGEATYSELVEYVVENTATPPETSTAEFRGRVAARLVHANIPKLAESGVVEHDSDTQTVVATAVLDSVRPYLELAREQTVETDDDDVE